MKLVPYVMATSVLLLAAPWAGARVVEIADPDEAGSLDRFIQIAGKPCEKACKACAKAFREACGGMGDYSCGFNSTTDRCDCDWSCAASNAKYAYDLEVYV